MPPKRLTKLDERVLLLAVFHVAEVDLPGLEEILDLALFAAAHKLALAVDDLLLCSPSQGDLFPQTTYQHQHQRERAFSRLHE